MIHTPVLIVGGGPVGLTLAICLSRQGIPSILVNDRLHTTTHPKLDVVNCRSMEIFRTLNLAEKVRAAGNPVSANQYCAIAGSANGPFYAVLTDQHLLYHPVEEARQIIRACDDGSLPLEPMQRIAQMNLEPVLLAAALDDPNIEVRLGWRLYGFERFEDRVIAMIENVDGGRSTQLSADYLVGCDGPSSRVRHFLNIDYDATRDVFGELFIIHIRSSAIAKLFPGQEPFWHTWITRPGFSGLLVSPDASRDDYVLHRPVPPAENESLEDIVDAALGCSLPYEIIQSGPWRPQFLVAERFGRGRVLIAGDATHQYMPTGGLGMNTGIAEVHNLAWKLAASLQGWGGPRLVESYEAERRPVALDNRAHVRKCAAAAFEATMLKLDRGREGELICNSLPEQIADGLKTKISRMYEALGTEIGYRYASSSVIALNGEPAPERDDIHYLPTTIPGARLPSWFLPNGDALLDALDPCGFTLLTDGTNDPDAWIKAALSRSIPLRVLTIDDDRIRGLMGGSAVLVRPDQHVAWRGDEPPADCCTLFASVSGY